MSDELEQNGPPPNERRDLKEPNGTRVKAPQVNKSQLPHCGEKLLFLITFFY